MSIPERFMRIAKHKLTEFRERIEQLDSEMAWRDEQKRQQEDKKAEARRELDDALANVSAPPPPANAGATFAPQGRLRTPEEISRSHQGGGGYVSTTVPTPSSAGSGSGTATTGDSLEYHYRLLGVEVGSDFVTVQNAYNKLAARSDPGRFDPGSEEERQAQEIRTRLEASYRALREVLDSTVRRMNMLEIDIPNADEKK